MKEKKINLRGWKKFEVIKLFKDFEFLKIVTVTFRKEKKNVKINLQAPSKKNHKTRFFFQETEVKSIPELKVAREKKKKFFLRIWRH